VIAAALDTGEIDVGMLETTDPVPNGSGRLDVRVVFSVESIDPRRWPATVSSSKPGRCR
jgi:hypothetical protein